MNELSKLNSGAAKVTVARPTGRIASAGDTRAVEAVTPVVLDNDAALGFLRDRARQNASDQGDKQFSQGNQADARRSGYDARPGADSYGPGRSRVFSAYHRASSDGLARGAADTGFVTQLMGQTEGELANASPTAQKKMLLERYSHSSEAYRRAGAEPVYYGEAPQLVRVAV